MPASTSPVIPPILTTDEAERLLDVARQTLEAALRDQQWLPDLAALPEPLRVPGACFVTLYTVGALHGCIGSIEPRQPLAIDAARNAVSAARNDPRFPVLTTEELDDTEIEISVLSPMQEISYQDIDELVEQLRPGVDGVLVERGWQRGLLLPQVWEKLPDPHEFLAHVALKANANVGIYNDPDARVFIFQADSYFEDAKP